MVQSPLELSGRRLTAVPSILPTRPATGAPAPTPTPDCQTQPRNCLWDKLKYEGLNIESRSQCQIRQVWSDWNHQVQLKTAQPIVSGGYSHYIIYRLVRLRILYDRRIANSQFLEGLRQSSSGYSHCCFTAQSDVDKELSEKITQAFVSMDYRDPVGKRAMDAEGCKAFLPGITEGWETLEEVAEKEG